MDLLDKVERHYAEVKEHHKAFCMTRSEFLAALEEAKPESMKQFESLNDVVSCHQYLQRNPLVARKVRTDLVTEFLRIIDSIRHNIKTIDETVEKMYFKMKKHVTFESQSAFKQSVQSLLALLNPTYSFDAFNIISEARSHHIFETEMERNFNEHAPEETEVFKPHDTAMVVNFNGHDSTENVSINACETASTTHVNGHEAEEITRTARILDSVDGTHETENVADNLHQTKVTRGIHIDLKSVTTGNISSLHETGTTASMDKQRGLLLYFPTLIAAETDMLKALQRMLDCCQMDTDAHTKKKSKARNKSATNK